MRLPRFGMRTLMCVITLVAVILGWQVTKAERQRRLVEALEARGARFIYAHEDGPPQPIANAPGTTFPLSLLSKHYFYRIVGVSLEKQVPAVDELQRLRTLGEVKYLECGGGELTPAHFLALQEMESLEQLWLRKVTFDNADLQKLITLPRLRSLALDDSSLNGAGLSHVGKCYGLESLVIRGTQVQSGDLALIRGLSKLGYLDAQRTELCDDDMASILQLKALTGIDLPPQLTDAAMVELAQHPGLQVVRVHDSPITDAGLQELLALPRLRSLWLYNTAVTPAWIQQTQQQSPQVSLTINGKS